MLFRETTGDAQETVQRLGSAVLRPSCTFWFLIPSGMGAVSREEVPSDMSLPVSHPQSQFPAQRTHSQAAS